MRCGKMVTLSPQSSSERWNGKAGNVEEVPRWQKQPLEQNVHLCIKCEMIPEIELHCRDVKSFIRSIT
jgi:hypothetical protein